ncbi:MAG: hypothetical protein ACXW3T_12475, partial [Rhodoplanes sp.]
MRRLRYALALGATFTAIALAAAAVSKSKPTAPVAAQDQAVVQSTPIAASSGKTAPDHPGFYLGEAILNPSERAGREIWYKATAGNARFHTYVFQQRVNVLIDWYRVLNA